MNYLPPYGPSVPDWMRQASLAVNGIGDIARGNYYQGASVFADLKEGSGEASANLAKIVEGLDLLSDRHGGGTLLIPYGVYDFSDEIPWGDGSNAAQSTKHHNIHLRGMGNGSSPSVSNVQTRGVTVLRYAGSSNAAKSVLNIKGPLHGVRISDVELDANSLAGIGITINHVDSFIFRNVTVRNWTANNYVFTTRTGFPSGVAHGCGNGTLYDCYAYDPASNSANGILLTSGVSTGTTLVGNPDTANLDIHGGVFFYGGSTGSYGIHFYGCDNNSYNGSQFVPAGGNDGLGASHKWTQWPASTVFPLGNQLRGGGFSQGMTGTAGTGGNFAWFDTSDSGWTPNIAGLSVQLTDGRLYIDGALVLGGTSVSLTEIAAGSVPAPAAGRQTLFIDTADHKLKRKDSAGTVTIIA